MEDLGERLSPRYLRQRGVNKAKHLMWQGTAKLLAFVQHTSVQASVVGGSALWLLIRNRNPGHGAPGKKRAVPVQHRTGTAAKAAGATGGLWMLLRKVKERELVGRKPPVSGMLLAATAAKAFLTGARSSKKRGTTQPGRKVAWRGVATAIGAALGSYWYSHRGHRA